MSDSNYILNQDRYNSIVQEFNYIGECSKYNTLINIATKEYAIYLNNISAKGQSIVNLGSEIGAFVVKNRKGVFVPNEPFIRLQKKDAKRGRGFGFFSFCFVNIVLDKFELSLSNRKS